MPGIFLTTNIFAHVGGFFMSGLDDGGDVCLQTNVVSAVVVGGANVTDETDKTDNNGQGVVTRLQTNACSLPPPHRRWSVCFVCKVCHVCFCP